MPSSSFRSSLDLEFVRSQFPTLERCVYLNTGTYGLVPEPAIKALLETTAAFDRGGVAAGIDLGAIQERVRTRVAAILNVDRSEIAITRNATDGNNLALAGIEWKPGDEVISTAEEHPSLQHPLLYLQATRGIKVHFLPISPDAETMLARIAAVHNDRTKLVAMSHVPCETGTRLPARDICRWAADHGVLSLFDGAQTWGAVPIDLRDIGCDFYAMNGHKWMCGPKGTGFFYARKERLVELRPAHVGAGSLEFADVETGRAEPYNDGRRFEFGSRGWGILAGFDASLDWFEDLGFQNVLDHIAGLAAYLKAGIVERPYLRLLTPEPTEHSSGLTSIAVIDREAGEVATTLREKWRIHTRMVLGGTGFRIATGHFNGQGDVDFLLSKLDEVVKE